MLHNYAKQHWFVLPVLSALLLVLSFHPFRVWPLIFVALVPLFYFVSAYPEFSKQKIFWGGFTTGALFALALSYFTVVQFHWIPEAYLFVWLVRLLFVPIALIGGALCGLGMLLYRVAHTQHAPLNAALNAAAYTLGEILLYTMCGGYYFAMVAYAAAPVSPLVLLAAAGGAFFVSFVVAWVNALIAGALAFPAQRRSLGAWAGGSALALLALYACLFLAPQGAPLQTLRIASIQTATSTGLGFGKVVGGTFAFPALEKSLRVAAQEAPGLLIYPFSPVEGALYTGAPQAFDKPILVAPEAAFAAWAGQVVPASTTLMVWTTSFASTSFYNEFQFIQEGSLVARYRKRATFPFIDYTPLWAQQLGFFSTQIDMTAGESSQSIMLGSLPVGALLCSEVQRQELATGESGRSALIISAGSEAVFVDDVASNFSLKAAQYRAAESGLPVVRANLLGPSGVIDSQGRLVAYRARGDGGTLQATLKLYEPQATLYSKFGNWPILGLLLAICVAAGVLRRREHVQ